MENELFTVPMADSSDEVSQHPHQRGKATRLGSFRSVDDRIKQTDNRSNTCASDRLKDPISTEPQLRQSREPDHALSQSATSGDTSAFNNRSPQLQPIRLTQQSPTEVPFITHSHRLYSSTGCHARGWRQRHGKRSSELISQPPPTPPPPSVPTATPPPYPPKNAGVSDANQHDSSSVDLWDRLSDQRTDALGPSAPASNGRGGQVTTVNLAAACLATAAGHGDTRSGQNHNSCSFYAPMLPDLRCKQSQAVNTSTVKAASVPGFHAENTHPPPMMVCPVEPTTTKVWPESMPMVTTKYRPSLSQKLRRQFVSFCENTSLRGVPRIVKTTDSKRRMLWSSFVFVFFVGCITCLFFIVGQYLAHDVIHQPKKMFNHSRSFPSVTVCNLRPFSTRGIRRLRKAGVISLQVFYRLLANLRRKNRLFSMVLNLESYLRNLPERLKKTVLGHTQRNFVQRCNLVYQKGSFNLGTKCSNAGTWKQTEDSIFRNCYTFTANETVSNQTLTLEMLLYLNNIVDYIDCFDCSSLSQAMQLTGARLSLHAADTYPFVKDDGVYMMPGTMSDIKFQIKEWTLLEPPHGRCREEARSRLRIGETGDYAYSEKACGKLNVQEAVAAACGCVTITHPMPRHLANRSLGQCEVYRLPEAVMTSGAESAARAAVPVDGPKEAEVLRRLNCSERVTKTYTVSPAACSMPCIRYTYDTKISTAQWPTKSLITVNAVSQLRTYRRRLAKAPNDNAEGNRELIELLTPYEELYNMSRTNRTKEAMERLMRLDTYESNFLSIAVSRSDFDIERIEEKAVVSLTSLFSQVGGLLSIWIGLTFVCIVEIFDLILNLIDTVLEHRRQTLGAGGS